MEVAAAMTIASVLRDIQEHTVDSVSTLLGMQILLCDSVIRGLDPL